MPNRLLIIGSSYTEGKPVGGAIVLFGKLQEYLKNHPNIYATFIKANLFKNQIKSLIHVLREVVRLRGSYDLVFLNVSQNGIVILFPLVSGIARLLGKKVAMRAFGSHALDDLNGCKWKAWLKWSFQNASLVGMETHFLVDEFKKYSDKVYWLPNVREQIEGVFDKEKTYSKRFLFVAQVKKSKGILEAIKAFEQLDDSYTFHFYGPIVDDELVHLEDHPWYKGRLEPKEVVPALLEYDGLILPTYYEGEGYPGVIIEAYQAGLFCVTTQWRNIPEIVQQDKTGFLLPAKDAGAIKECIQNMDQEIFNQLRKEIEQYRLQFETNRVHQDLFQILINAD
jgi:glycosyltransferase involved in cell wall biosynthesis